MGIDPNQAVKQFFGDPDWRVKAGVGGIFSAGAFLLCFLGPLFIPIAFCLWGLLVGYYLRLIRTKVADSQAPLPAWNDWLDLLISGITWIAVLFGQSLVPISLATILLLCATTGGQNFVTSNQFTLWAASSVSGVILTWVIVSIISAIVMANFAKQERMAAAFDIITVARKLASSAHIFFQAWLLMLGIQWLGFILPVVSVLGIALIPICGFVASCIGSVVLAQAWTASEQQQSEATGQKGTEATA